MQTVEEMREEEEDSNQGIEDFIEMARAAGLERRTGFLLPCVFEAWTPRRRLHMLSEYPFEVDGMEEFAIAVSLGFGDPESFGGEDEIGLMLLQNPKTGVWSLSPFGPDWRASSELIAFARDLGLTDAPVDLDESKAQSVVQRFIDETARSKN